MYDATGKKVWEGVLDIYGRIRTLCGSGSEMPFRYQGQYEDVETGLYYNRFRYYSSEEGVYISQDPIGLVGGMALYRYVQDPNTWIDIFGLSCGEGKRLPNNPHDVPNLFPGKTMQKTVQPDGKIIHQFEHNGKEFKIEFHPEHGGADHFPGDHYHIKQLSSAPPPGKTKPIWFRLQNTDPLSPTTPGGGTFAAGDLLPSILQ
jgi:RHS repeat-associated protein